MIASPTSIQVARYLVEFVIYVITNTNEIITYVTLRRQNSIHIKDRVIHGLKKFRIHMRHLDIKENLFL